MRLHSNPKLFVVSVLALAPFASAQLSPAERLAGSESIGVVRLADVTGDGVLDLIASGTGLNSSTVLLGVGNGGGFGPLLPIATGIGPLIRSMRTADFNGDGRVDVLVRASGRVALLFQGAVGVFQQPTTLATGDSGSMEIGDLDGDGDIDFVLGGRQAQDRIFTNDGDGAFFESSLGGSVDSATNSLKFLDIDADGDVDILRGTNAAVYVHVNQGTSIYTQSVAVPNGRWFANFGDLDGDGLPDIVVASEFGGPVAWSRNLGGGSFAAPQNLAASIFTLSDPQITDVNGDGILDVIVCDDTARRVLWFAGSGMGAFGAAVVLSVADQTPLLDQLVDLDGDSDLDAVVHTGVALFTVPGFSVLENQSVAGLGYCAAVPNSTGLTGTISARGSQRISVDRLTLEARQLPVSAFGYFINSVTSDFTPTFGSGVGNLCLGGGIGRLNRAGEIRNSGMSGAVELSVDLGSIPTASGVVAVAAGETWYFQCWYRDSLSGAATSNLTNGVRLSFR